MPDSTPAPPRKLTPEPEFSIVRPYAAGLDIGAEEIWAASPPGGRPDTVATFESFTAGLHSLKTWLKDRGVTTVAMESTGVYWIPVYDVL